MIQDHSAYMTVKPKIFSNPKKYWAILDENANIIEVFKNELAAQAKLEVLDEPDYYIEEVNL